MLGAAVLLMQVAAGSPAPIDLRAAVRRPCPPAEADGDVVVCAERDESPRLARLPERPVQPPLDPMSFRLPGGGKGNVHAIQTQLPGAIGQGGAVTLTIPFGKRKKE